MVRRCLKLALPLIFSAIFCTPTLSHDNFLEPKCTGKRDPQKSGSICWWELENIPRCYVRGHSGGRGTIFFPKFQWSGRCEGGTAEGGGQLSFRNEFGFGSRTRGTGSLVDGVKEGVWTFVFPGGSTGKGSYKVGFEQGKWTYRYENGPIGARPPDIRELRLQRGLAALGHAGEIKSEGRYVDGEEEGLWVHYGPLGGFSRGRYHHGKREGRLTYEWLNICVIDEYDQDKRIKEEACNFCFLGVCI